MAVPILFLVTKEDWLHWFVFCFHPPSTPFSAFCNRELACHSGELNQTIEGSGRVPRHGLMVSVAFVLRWGTDSRLAAECLELQKLSSSPLAQPKTCLCFMFFVCGFLWLLVKALHRCQFKENCSIMSVIQNLTITISC